MTRTNCTLMMVVVVTSLAACRSGEPPTTAEVVAVARHTAPTDPQDELWRRAPVHLATMIPQDMVEPRLMEPSTTQVRVQAVADGREVAFRLEWLDASQDDVPGPGRFSDACAVQVPSQPAADAPAPQMGEAGRSVEISYWRATWQAVTDGRARDIKDLYPGAAVDHYPFDAASLPKDSAEQLAMQQRYAPAHALGNPMAGPRDRPVQDLLAAGPGSLVPAAETRSNGRGVRTPTGWAVVLRRPLPAGLGPASRSQVAFAVWEGAHDEVGARKMRTGWIQMAMEAQP